MDTMVERDLQTRTRRAEGFYLSPAAVFVIVPTYNEAENLPELAAALFKLPVPNLSLVVVDDNSPDGTGEVAEDLARQYPERVHVLHRPGKQGLGVAYQHGFRYALENGADYIIQMDADFSHSPEYIPLFLERMQEYDMVIGSRYAPGGQLDPRWSVFRNWLSRWANSIYVRLILGVDLYDATGGFKCWDRRALAAVLEQPISSSGFIFQVETSYIAGKLGYRICEVPIFFGDRVHGESKMNSSIKLEAAWRTWYLRWRYRNLKAAELDRAHG